MNALAVFEFVHATLTGDGTMAGLIGSRLYEPIAPQDASGIYGVYRVLTDPADTVGLGAERLMTSIDLQLLFGCEGNDLTQVEAAANRADALLQRASGTVSRGIVIGCHRVRESIPPPVFDSSGRMHRSMGHIWRFWAQEG